jgi:hypothetical protein
VVSLGIAAAAGGVPFVGSAVAAAALGRALDATVVLAITLGAIGFYQRPLQDASGRLRARQEEFIAAADRVLEQCCPHCITVDLILRGCT